MRRLVLVLAAACAAAGCSSGAAGDGEADPAPAERAAGQEPAGPTVAFPRAEAVIERRDGGSVRLTVELARTTEERSVGLMGRRSLPAGHGMLFVFPRPSQAGFWMKDTLVPLSIAFVADDGRILEILDMEPCRADPCPVYPPSVTYRSALEVNRGAFGRWGVEVGDRIRLPG